MMVSTYLEKRSMRIAGHRTSIAMEPEFWAGFEESAARMALTLPRLAAIIDEQRAKHHPEQSLASAIRVHVLDCARKRAA
jgi:predicted DNA-binding ribbon-helix-helix protein